MTVARQRTWLLLALFVAAAGCDSQPSCGEIEHNVARVTRQTDERVRAGAAGAQLQYLPQFGDYVTRIAEQCRAGKLDRRTRDCLYAARTGIDVDRCAGR